MLVLMRRGGESIRIGDCVTVKILGIVGGSVCIGVTAPREIRVDRKEVHERRQLALRPRVAHASHR